MPPSAGLFPRDRYFTPVPDEITTHDLPVTGTLPPELAGAYLRNGPNPRPGSDPRLFVAGDGMVHGIRLEAGQARWYRNRYVRTRREAGIRGGSSSNTHVFTHAGHLLSFVEVALPIELDRELETVGPDLRGADLRNANLRQINLQTTRRHPTCREGATLAAGTRAADSSLLQRRLA